MDLKLQFENNHVQEVKLLAPVGFVLIALGLPKPLIGTHYLNLKLNVISQQRASLAAPILISIEALVILSQTSCFPL